MERHALKGMKVWWDSGKLGQQNRKPLVLRGARQVGKSFLVRDFCQRQGLQCLELNFEKEPSLRRLFVEGHNSKTKTLLEGHFRQSFNEKTLLFLDEIQAAPEVFARLRYFYEDSPEIPVAAAGSLLEFALTDLEYSVPVGRIQYLYLGAMSFEEYLLAQGEDSLLGLLRNWRPDLPEVDIPAPFHDRLLSHVRDFSLVGGMPEAVSRFSPDRDFLGCESVQRAILETYRQDFSKFRKRIPLERLDRVFAAIPREISKKWVHARVSPHDKAASVENALDALCKAQVAHRVFHSSGNGVPLAAEQKDNLYKVLFIDVGLMGIQLGLRITDLTDIQSLLRVNEGAVAEQWIGQHLLYLRPLAEAPQLFYWVREKAGAMAEVDYLYAEGSRVYPVEVKAGSSSRAKSLQVFLSEKPKAPLGIHFSLEPAELRRDQRILRLPFYLVEQLPRILTLAC